MKIPLLLVLGWHTAAKAQGSGEVYAAPGMPMHLQRGVPTLPARRPSGAPAVAGVRKPPAPVLARFWTLSDTAKWRAAQSFYRFLSS